MYLGTGQPAQGAVRIEFKRKGGGLHGLRSLLGKRPAQQPFSKKKARVTYTHRFLCLSKCCPESKPTTDREKDILLEAGLGEKKIIIPDVDMSGEDFRDLLLEEFPKLGDGGGFMFAKCRSNSRSLESLSFRCLTSPKTLRDRVGNARTYIIPMQKDLNISPVANLPPGVSLM